MTIQYAVLEAQSLSLMKLQHIAKHTKVDMIWVAGRSPTLVSYSLRGVAMNLKATTLTYLAISLYQVLPGLGRHKVHRQCRADSLVPLLLHDLQNQRLYDTAAHEFLSRCNPLNGH